MTSQKKHHGGLHVVFGQRYKNAHNFIINDQTCLQLYDNLSTLADVYPVLCSTLGVLYTLLEHIMYIVSMHIYLGILPLK